MPDPALIQMMANVFSFHQCEFGARGCLLHIDHQGYGALLLGALLSPVPMRGNWYVAAS